MKNLSEMLKSQHQHQQRQIQFQQFQVFQQEQQQKNQQKQQQTVEGKHHAMRLAPNVLWGPLLYIATSVPWVTLHAFLHENKDAMVLLEAPGMADDAEVVIVVERGCLTLRGNRKDVAAQFASRRKMLSSSNFGAFVVEIALPIKFCFDEAAITAKYECGMIFLHLPFLDSNLECK